MASRKHPALEVVDDIRAKNGHAKNGHDRPRPITAAELMNMEFAPTRWVVPDVLPEGVTLLVGKPKKGKSWMALGMCEAVAVGGVALGTKRVEQGDTLYLALEDNVKRLKKRLKKVLDGRAAPETMHLHTEWPRLDQGGAEQLDEWLTEHPDARLVVIDTLAKIRRPVGGANVYAEDYAALEQLLPLAAKHGVAIVVVHHLRKAAAADPMDEISSSTGLTGGVDGFLILRRTPGSKGPTLYVDGRDIEEPTEYALHWNLNTATWTIEGTAEEVHVSKERGDILLTLNRHRKPMTPREVTDAMPGAKYNNVKYLMWAMLGDGQLVKDDKGRYYPTNPTNPTNSANPANSANPTPVSGLAVVPEATNPSNGDTYGKNGHTVSGVSGVSGVGKNGDAANPAGASEDWRDRKALEALRRGNGPRKALSNFEEDDTPFEYVVRSVMHYWGRGGDPVDDWEAAVIHAVGVLKNAVNTVNSDGGGAA
ncbi:MAG: helicase RepA family protein [Actinomycetota bacterium]|nr:helicase RepA family protein [Actinomycetota bacterium]